MTVYLSLGANLGNREQTINRAIEMISEQVGPLIKRSEFYYSKPVGFVSEHDFCNICASFETNLSPLDLLHATQAIERALGRTHKSTICNQKPVYSDRTIDIDILTYGDLTINTPELTIPHPEMQKRDFVMTPVREILQ